MSPAGLAWLVPLVINKENTNVEINNNKITINTTTKKIMKITNT